jgi:SAD/SRA domain
MAGWYVPRWSASPLQAGISGSAYEGADSIVVSGGYEDDRDNGFEIIYTGHGGRDPETGEQVPDQELTRGNMALVYSMNHMLPVRVVRGATHTSPFSPKAGYRYDGLYLVEHYWQEKGKSGYMVWRYRLVKEDKSSAPWLSSVPVQAKVRVGDNKARPVPKPTPKQTSPRTVTNLPTTSRRPQVQEPAAPQFRVGDHVRHPAFGNGQVLDVSPSGEDQILTVQFSALGKKRLMAKAAKLELLPRNTES